MEYKNKIGDTLRILREHYGASQKDIYTRLGIKQTTYSNYENNTREPPFRIIAELCRIYEIYIDDFYNHLIDNIPLELPDGDAINIFHDKTKADQNLEFIKSDLNKMNEFGQQLALDLMRSLRSCPPLLKDFNFDSLIKIVSRDEIFNIIENAFSELKSQENMTEGEDNGDDSEV